MNRYPKVIVLAIVALVGLGSVGIAAGTSLIPSSGANQVTLMKGVSQTNGTQTTTEERPSITREGHGRLLFAWYSMGGEAKVRISTEQSMTNPKVYTGTVVPGVILENVHCLSNKVMVDGLEQGKSYWYQVQVDGKWQPAINYTL